MRLIPTRSHDYGQHGNYRDRNKPSITADGVAGQIKYTNEDDPYKFDANKDATKCIQHISVVDYAKTRESDTKVQIGLKLFESL